MIMKKARKLRRQLHGNITLFHVKKYIEAKGFSVIYFNTIEGDYELRRYDLMQYAETKNAFTYVSSVKLIFINNACSEETKLLLLLHEIGHIEVNINIGISDIDNIKSEVQADAFANEVMTGEYSKMKKHSSVITVALLAFSLCTVSMTVSSIAHFPSVSTDTVFSQENKVADYSSNPYELQEPSPSALQTKDIVYILPTGKKYHKEECRFVSDQAISVERSRLSDAYTPCKLCQP